MSDVNSINKIFVKSAVNIKNVNMTTLLFIDNLIISKSRYSVVNKSINILDSASENISLYHNVDSCDYYEYQVNLQQTNTTIAGLDRFKNKLHDLDKRNIIVFVNGYKLLNSEFQIASKNSIIIYPSFISERISTVIIYASNKLFYYGNVFDQSTWYRPNNQFELKDYSDTRYIFFKNGEQIPYDRIFKDGDIIKLNIIIKDSDIIEFYQLPNDTSVCTFDGMAGYLSYGPLDKHKKEVPLLCNAIVTFEKPAYLLIDNLREGFFLKEEDGTGSLMFLNDDYNSSSVNAIILNAFPKSYYGHSEYFVQVPETTSILKYTSEFDLNGKLFPELLGIFQRVLLDEVYDSLQRLKNIRNINKVDTTHLSALIHFLGFNIKINNITADQKRRLLDELNNFYNIVGTRASYNFYNFVTEGSSLVQLDQLFTPIKDNNDKANPLKRYVDFKAPSEFIDDYTYHKEYSIPVTDYGLVEEIASLEDKLTNMPRSEGIVENIDEVYSPQGIREVYITNEDGTTTTTYKYIPANPYVTQPVVGPNEAVIDYGWITDNAEDFIDYGLVSDKIKGEWIEWYEWNRDKSWYPTNHVNACITVPVDVDYSQFIKYFMNTFYKIASTVVYLHSVIQVFSFGPSNGLLDDAGGKVSILTSPVYNQQEYTFTSDPRRQPDKHWTTKVDPSWTTAPWVDTIWDPINKKWIPGTYPVVENPCPQELKLHSDFETCKEIVFRDTEYVIFAYKYDNGKHLDTFTKIVNSKNDDYNIGVGYYASTGNRYDYPNYKVPYYPAYRDEESAPPQDPDALVQWARHNRGSQESQGHKEENVLINVNNFNNDQYKNDFEDIIIFDLYCAFLQEVTPTSCVSIVLRGYKGGTIIQDPNNWYRYINIDDQGRERTPKYEAEQNLPNVYIQQTVTDIRPNGYKMIPETTDLYDYNGRPVKGRLRKVTRVYLNRKTKTFTFEIIPNQDS